MSTGPLSSVRTTAAPHTRTHEAQHEHSWATDSRHRTSTGYVLYVRCTACGTHRVDVQAHRETPPAPLSRAVGGTPVRPAS
jgi:hypothetical protein